MTDAQPTPAPPPIDPPSDFDPRQGHALHALPADLMPLLREMLETMKRMEKNSATHTSSDIKDKGVAGATQAIDEDRMPAGGTVSQVPVPSSDESHGAAPPSSAVPRGSEEEAIQPTAEVLDERAQHRKDYEKRDGFWRWDLSTSVQYSNQPRIAFYSKCRDFAEQIREAAGVFESVGGSQRVVDSLRDFGGALNGDSFLGKHLRWFSYLWLEESSSRTIWTRTTAVLQRLSGAGNEFVSSLKDIKELVPLSTSAMEECANWFGECKKEIEERLGGWDGAERDEVKGMELRRYMFDTFIGEFYEHMEKAVSELERTAKTLSRTILEFERKCDYMKNKPLVAVAIFSSVGGTRAVLNALRDFSAAFDALKGRLRSWVFESSSRSTWQETRDIFKRLLEAGGLLRDSLADIKELKTFSLGALESWNAYISECQEKIKGYTSMGAWHDGYFVEFIVARGLSPFFKEFPQRFYHLMAKVYEDDDEADPDLELVAGKGIEQMLKSEENAVQKYLTMTTIATFFSGVTATTLQFSFQNTDTRLHKAVNLFWITSLVFSIASAINSLLGMTWRKSPLSWGGKSDRKVFIRANLQDTSKFVWSVSGGNRQTANIINFWLEKAPMVFLIIAALEFIIGLVLFVYSTQQGKLVEISVASLAALHILALVLVTVIYHLELKGRTSVSQALIRLEDEIEVLMATPLQYLRYYHWKTKDCASKAQSTPRKLALAIALLFFGELSCLKDVMSDIRRKLESGWHSTRNWVSRRLPRLGRRTNLDPHNNAAPEIPTTELSEAQSLGHNVVTPEGGDNAGAADGECAPSIVESAAPVADVPGGVSFDEASVLERGGNLDREGDNSRADPTSSRLYQEASRSEDASQCGTISNIAGQAGQSRPQENSRNVVEDARTGQPSAPAGSSPVQVASTSALRTPGIGEVLPKIEDVRTSEFLTPPCPESSAVHEATHEEDEDIELANIRPRRDSIGVPVARPDPEVPQDAPASPEPYTPEIIHREGGGSGIGETHEGE